jgi:hypothetical protein
MAADVSEEKGIAILLFAPDLLSLQGEEARAPWDPEGSQLAPSGELPYRAWVVYAQ